MHPELFRHKKSGDLTGHLKILKKIKMETLTKPTDHMPIARDFQRSFVVVIRGRQELKDEMFQPEREAMVWYTDGSKMKEGVGAGVYGSRCRISKPLGKTPSIFKRKSMPLIFAHLKVPIRV